MVEPKMSPSTRVCLERIQALPINAARRSEARSEFERAEASIEALLAIVGRLRQGVAAFRRTFAVRRQRLG